MKLRWYEYRVGATWIKHLQYLDENSNIWTNVPTVRGEYKE